MQTTAINRDLTFGAEHSKVETRTSAFVAAAGVVVAYILAGELGLRFATVNPSATAVWAPSGIALASCLLLGYWVWPMIFAGAFLVNLTTHGSVPSSAAIAVGNTLEALTAAYLVRRFARGVRVFDVIGDTFRFVLFAAVLSTTIAATIGVTSLCLTGYAAWPKFEWIWLTWWLGDATGDLIVVPLIILCARSPRPHWDRGKFIEGVLLIGTLMLTAVLVFDIFLPFWGPHTFLFLPVLLWAAFRFGPRDTAAVVFILSLAAIAFTLISTGWFGDGGGNTTLLFVQVFVAVTGTSNLIVAIEVAERRRLDEARWRLGAIVESSDDAIIAISPEGQITAWNAGAERMYEFSATEAIGNRLNIIIPPERIGESAEVLARINHGETIPPFETVRLRKDGAQLDVYLTVSPVKDGDGRIIGASKIARDITRLKQARQEQLRSERVGREAAESANRAKDEFLAMLGHELRNPLQAISLAAQLLQNPSGLDKARGIITRQGDHVSRLVDDLLDAARVTSGKIVLNREPLNLTELVAECLGSMRETGQLARHTLETELETVWVDGDSDRLAQVVTNLLGNAVKFTQSGGKVRVRLKAGGEEATLEVQDDGAGISSDILPRVFDLFAHGELGLQGSPGGLGIGLTLVKRIAELHGGTVEAASDGLGRGSRFRVTLPRIATPQPQRIESGDQPDEPIRPHRILVIEDNDDARESLSTWLEASGHEIFQAADGPSGVDKAVEVQPDIVLIDLGLPGLDGYEVADRIRSPPRCSAATLIALTGYGLGEYQAKAAGVGFNYYLVKPIDTVQLEKLISAASSG